MKKPVYAYSPDRLYALLELHDVEVGKLAEICGVSRQMVHRWLTGGRPSLRCLLKICNHFGINPGYFFPDPKEKRLTYFAA